MLHVPQFKTSDISSINSPLLNDDDDMESFSDEIATDFRNQRKSTYRELDYYMEKIVEIQEQLAN